MQAGLFVKVALKGLGIHQQDFAMELGVERTHLSHVLSGRRKFSPLMARVVAAALKARKIRVKSEDLERGEVPDATNPFPELPVAVGG